MTRVSIDGFGRIGRSFSYTPTQLDGKIGGIAVRAPVPVGSIVDLVVGARTRRRREEPLVSNDIVHSPYSCIFDSELTMTNGRLVKVFGWYDNEWGYSCRLVELVERMF